VLVFFLGGGGGVGGVKRSHTRCDIGLSMRMKCLLYVSAFILYECICVYVCVHTYTHTHYFIHLLSKVIINRA